MKNKDFALVPIYALILLGFIILSLTVNDAATVISQSEALDDRVCFVIDPGHGGIDGGAVSCTGAYESHINLEIALRLNDLIGLLGYDTLLTRDTDVSIYTSGDSIAAKKASDLKERVRIVNSTPGAILLSIHQNHYHNSYYQGGQMFYAETEGSEELADFLQNGFNSILNTAMQRHIKKAEGLYLMRHINKPGVLIECGFLSNPQEELNLREPRYQLKLCCVIASACSNYVQQKGIA